MGIIKKKAKPKKKIKVKSKKRTRPSKAVVEAKKADKPRVKNRYEKAFEVNLANIQAPTLTSQVKPITIKGEKFIQVSVIHPNTKKVIESKLLPPTTDLNTAFDEGKKMKLELSKTVKTWVQGSPDDPNYIHSDKEKK